MRVMTFSVSRFSDLESTFEDVEHDYQSILPRMIFTIPVTETGLYHPHNNDFSFHTQHASAPCEKRSGAFEGLPRPPRLFSSAA